MKENIIFRPLPVGVQMFSYKKSYYLKRPFHFVREVWIGIKNYWHRSRYGWAWVDLWNMDLYLRTIIPVMLRQLASRSSGTPNQFESMEEYQAYLNALAQLFEVCEYGGARTSVLELHDTENSIAERLYARAKAAIGEDPETWCSELMKFCFAELGYAAAEGWLWD